MSRIKRLVVIWKGEDNESFGILDSPVKTKEECYKLIINDLIENNAYPEEDYPEETEDEFRKRTLALIEGETYIDANQFGYNQDYNIETIYIDVEKGEMK